MTTRLDAIGLRHGTDKASDGHDYLKIYQGIMPVLRPVRLLEIGWFDGASMKTWRSYLHEESTIVGVDIEPKKSIGGVHFRRADATSLEIVPMAEEFGPFDFIIDDGSHLSPDVIASFILLWSHVAPGGYYIVEDLHVSYHPDWQGFDHPTKPGPHGETSMQFLKRVADDVHFGHSIAFYPGVAIIRKAE
jgi:8-demethyl-8-(2-methoxy-alpha-L-rhamnosyl)tetracenomycin-C 3'-O-methyltransferase